MLVWYEVLLIHLMSPNDCISFHFRELIELPRRVSRLTKTASASRARKMQDRNDNDYVFILMYKVILYTKG